MAKIPGLDNLKKIGGDLLDKKNLGSMVDKLKSTVSSKSHAGVESEDASDPVQATLKELDKLLLALGEAHADQARQLTQLRKQLNVLMKIVPAVPMKEASIEKQVLEKVEERVVQENPVEKRVPSSKKESDEH